MTPEEHVQQVETEFNHIRSVESQRVRPYGILAYHEFRNHSYGEGKGKQENCMKEWIVNEGSQ
jgi:hypothetical protein